ncbi:MAG TPA: hypothetical protein PKM88_09320, partial [bacterium]|nr:hypothetical protein [bacterium]
AGWTLPDAVLTLTDRLILIEPNPLAVWLLQRRLRQLAPAAVVAADARDYFADAAGPGELRAAYGNDLLLFCNLLGQLRLISTPERYLAMRGVLREMLAVTGLAWVSYHDRLSADQAPVLREEAAPRRLTDAECRTRFFPGLALDEMDEHDTESLFPAVLPATFLTWQLLPHRYHLIELCGSPLPAIDGGGGGC